jgi:UbiD family decarboxylase
MTHDLRDWLAKVNEMGELKHLEGADWNLEIGTISGLNIRKENGPALLFDNIKGYPKGFRVLTCSTHTRRRLEFTFNLPESASTMNLVESMREKLPEWERTLKEFPYEVVKTGPILENIRSGKDINLFEFPVPKWHERDGGRYIGTGDAVITRDPETGEVNLGTYRIMVHDERTTAMFISPGKHGRMHYEKYHALGKPCPVAMSFGHHPLIFRTAATEVPFGSEYPFIGAISGKPVKVIEEEITGLPIPAESEIVVVGWIPPGKTKMEGPFGEWTGYYASNERPAPIVEVERIYFRNEPILVGSPPFRPPSETTLFIVVKGSAVLWNNLIKSGIPDIKGVWMSEVGHQQLVIVSLKQRYPGHARQAALLACQNRPAAYHGRYVIVVDEDIDPSDIQQVLWAVCTRSDPEKDIEILRGLWSTPLDTTIRKPTNAYVNSRAIIDACKPYDWITEFPEDLRIDAELEEKTRKKWGDVLKL